MSVREARFGDHWRHVFTRPYPTRVEKITYGSLYCLRDGEITFGPGISALIGSNGVGKSTLIAAIAELLRGVPAASALGHAQRLRGSRLNANAFFGEQPFTISVEPSEDGNRQSNLGGFQGLSYWLEPSFLARECHNLFYHDANFQDHLEGVKPYSLNEAELEIVSYLVGKEYSTCRVYEISDLGDFERLPYFQVTAYGIEYGSEGMGQGELSLLLVYWMLRDVQNNSILILDEPETHVSPRSQRALMNVIAKFCREKGIWTIIATHSPTIIQRIRRENIALLVRADAKSELAKSATSTQIANLLGEGVTFRGAILVEDEAGKAFLVYLLEELDPDLLAQLEIVKAGSADEIGLALSGMPKTSGWLNLIGIFDGDQRGKVDAGKHRWPHTFLPGEQPSEAMLRGLLLTRADAEALALLLHKPVDSIIAGQDAALGLDFHDWIRTLKNSIQTDQAMVTRALVQMWLRNEKNKGEAAALIKEVRRLADA
jgi:energy-coupling factor transporter ATP-binding protein EcfA2